MTAHPSIFLSQKSSDLVGIVLSKEERITQGLKVLFENMDPGGLVFIFTEAPTKNLELAEALIKTKIRCNGNHISFLCHPGNTWPWRPFIPQSTRASVRTSPGSSTTSWDRSVSLFPLLASFQLQIVQFFAVTENCKKCTICCWKLPLWTTKITHSQVYEIKDEKSDETRSLLRSSLQALYNSYCF